MDLAILEKVGETGGFCSKRGIAKRHRSGVSHKMLLASPQTPLKFMQWTIPAKVDADSHWSGSMPVYTFPQSTLTYVLVPYLDVHFC